MSDSTARRPGASTQSIRTRSLIARIAGGSRKRFIDVLADPALVASVTAPLGGPALPGLRSAGIDEVQARWGGGMD